MVCVYEACVIITCSITVVIMHGLAINTACCGAVPVPCMKGILHVLFPFLHHKQALAVCKWAQDIFPFLYIISLLATSLLKGIPHFKSFPR